MLWSSRCMFWRIRKSDS